MAYFVTRSLQEVREAAELANSAYLDVPSTPKGWKSLSATDLALPPKFFTSDGEYFIGSLPASSARIMINKNDKSIAVSFTGTDDGIVDFTQYIALYKNTYAKAFETIFDAISESKYKDWNLTISGHSLGGAAVNQIANDKSFWNLPSNTAYYSFESPLVYNKSGIINYGHRNDLIYQSLNNHNSGSTSNDNTSYVNDDLISFPGNSHKLVRVIEALKRLEESTIYKHLEQDSPLAIIDSGDTGSYSVKVKFSGLYVLGKGSTEEVVTRDAVTGSSYGDIIDLISGNDHANGKEGNDKIYGGKGNDTLVGGRGGDMLYGQSGNDTFILSKGDVEIGERIFGGSVLNGEVNSIFSRGDVELQNARIADINALHFEMPGKLLVRDSQISLEGISLSTAVIGSEQKDELAFWVGTNSRSGKLDISAFTFLNWSSPDMVSILGHGVTDTIIGSVKKDSIAGVGGADIISGMGGNDTIRGGAGADSMRGGTGNDFFVFQAGEVIAGEVVDGGSLEKDETNSIVGTGAIDFRFAKISSIDSITFGNSADFKFSGAQIKAFIAADAALIGAGKLYIGAGDAKNDFSLLDLTKLKIVGSVLINGSDIAQTIIGTANADQILGQGGADQIFGNGGNDTLYGGDGVDNVAGGDGSDLLYGGAGKDTISGDDGNDTLVGGAGLDTLYGEDGEDTFVYSYSELANKETAIGGYGYDRVIIDGSSNIDVTYNNDHGFRIGSVYAKTVSNIYFSNLEDHIEINSEIDYVSGETVYMGGGNDYVSVSGVRGTVVIDGGDGIDTVICRSSTVKIIARNPGDSIDGGGGTQAVSLWTTGVKITNCDGIYLEVNYNGNLDADKINTDILGITMAKSSTNLTIGFEGGMFVDFAGTRQNLHFAGNLGGVLELNQFTSGEDKLSLDDVSAIWLQKDHGDDTDENQQTFLAAHLNEKVLAYDYYDDKYGIVRHHEDASNPERSYYYVDGGTISTGILSASDIVVL